MTRKELIEQEAERMFEKLDSSADNSTKLEALSARGIFISGAQFADSLDRWVKVEDGVMPEYTNLIFLTQEGGMFQGFKNKYGKIMKGAEGRWATQYIHDIDDEITHYQIINPPIK